MDGFTKWRIESEREGRKQGHVKAVEICSFKIAAWHQRVAIANIYFRWNLSVAETTLLRKD